MDAKSVVIVGAGAVGTELAGEIATAQPDKQITLISTDDGLFPSYGAKMGASLVKKLKAKGVTVVLGQRVENLKQTKTPNFGSVTLTDGTKIHGDLIFPVIGSRAQTELLSDLPGVESGTLGRVKTDDWMRPSSYPNLFVAGDIADVGDGMTIVTTSRQNPWLIKTLKALLAGQSIEVLKSYTPWKKSSDTDSPWTQTRQQLDFHAPWKLRYKRNEREENLHPKIQKGIWLFRQMNATANSPLLRSGVLVAAETSLELH